VANDRAVGEVINIGSSEEVSIEQLAHLVKKHTNSKSTISHIPYDQAYEAGFEDMPRRVPCLEKLERLTAFRPATSLSEIIDRVSRSLLHPPPQRAAVASSAAGAATP
jgi:UDP-glucose 4-epimerase